MGIGACPGKGLEGLLKRKVPSGTTRTRPVDHNADVPLIVTESEPRFPSGHGNDGIRGGKGGEPIEPQIVVR